MTGEAVAYVGGGLAVLVLTVGAAFALVAWLNKRATSIYPNLAGQYPLVVKRLWNGVIVHDPNRALGPTTIYTAPSLWSALFDGLLATQPEAIAQFPQPGSEQAMLQVASQANAIGVTAAANRWPQVQIGGSGGASVRGAPGIGALPPVGRMPAIRVVDDRSAIDGFEQRLIEAEDA